MKGRVFLLLFILFVSFSCRNSSNKEGEFVFPVADSVQISEFEKLTPEAIADISKNISSSAELANLLQMLEVPFSSDYLAASIDADKQNTDFDKAMKLGILGADLGYLNMYEKTASSLDLVASIRKLAEDLRVGQFFDFESIIRLSKNRSNLDSLLFISIDSYTQIDKYLRENEREHISALMIIGVWLEGEYLATQIVGRFPEKMLSDRIGEQKIILNDLILLIKPYRYRDQEFIDLYKDLQEIRNRYQDIKITYTLGEPMTAEKDGGLVVTQTESSVVEMSKDQLESIIEVTRNIRTKLILND